MIQKINGVEQVGIYSVAYSIGNAINIIINSINQAIIPWLYRKLKENKYSEIRKNIIYIFGEMLLIISIFILVTPEILSIIASAGYSDALYVISPIAASAFFSLIYGLFATIEFYFDKNKFSMVISGVVAIINVILNLIFINLFDYRAAGYTTMVCYALLAIGHLIYTNRIIKNKQNEYLVKNSTMIFIIFIMIGIAVISQFIYKLIYIRYVAIVFVLLLVFSSRKKILRKFDIEQEKSNN